MAHDCQSLPKLPFQEGTIDVQPQPKHQQEQEQEQEQESSGLPNRKSKKHHVSFHGEVILILFTKDTTKATKKWYSKNDVVRMKQEMRDSIQEFETLMRSSGEDRSIRRTSSMKGGSSTGRGRDDMVVECGKEHEVYCHHVDVDDDDENDEDENDEDENDEEYKVAKYLGLSPSHKIYVEKSIRKKTAIKRVLAQQKENQRLGIDDPHGIALISRVCSRWAKNRALLDAEESAATGGREEKKKFRPKTINKSSESDNKSDPLPESGDTTRAPTRRLEKQEPHGLLPFRSSSKRSINDDTNNDKKNKSNNNKRNKDLNANKIDENVPIPRGGSEKESNIAFHTTNMRSHGKKKAPTKGVVGSKAVLNAHTNSNTNTTEDGEDLRWGDANDRRGRLLRLLSLSRSMGA